MTDRYAVIGHPVAHSRSPEIHAAFAAETGQALEYARLPAAPDSFAVTARAFFDNGGLGLNVTLPFKQQAALFADSVSTYARAAGAVNTLTLQADGIIAGDNTDGVGLLHDLLDNFEVALADRRVLILGAGGAVRGVVAPLLEAMPSALLLANRTRSKAEIIASAFADSGPIRACGLDELAEHRGFDIVINAISAGLQGEMPELPGQLFSADAAAYDMIYADTPTPFLRWAASAGVPRRRDGFGMLVEQAAESFRIWRGVRPQTKAVMANLRPDTA